MGASSSPPTFPAASNTEWRTPIRPLKYEEMWCVWDYGGVYEWMVHPDMAGNLERTGIRVDGTWCPVARIDDWPEIGAVQIRAVKHRREDVYAMTAAAA